PTLFFVAPDTAEKRRQYGLQAEQTFPLSAAVAPEDATELLRILHDRTTGTRIDTDTRSRTITMRDTPERLALAGELIQQLERARGEVMLEIEFLEVDRNKARALGITPPASSQLISLNTNDVNKLKSSTTLTNLLTNIQQIFAGKGFSSIPAVAANSFTDGSFPDLAVVFDDPKANTFVILQDQDNGNFVQVTPSPITLGANETGQVAIGTGVFRNDLTKFPTTQPPDVVLVNSTSNNVSVLLGSDDANGKANGLFTEAPGSPFAVGNNPRSVVVADFNGDGLLYFALAIQGEHSI